MEDFVEALPEGEEKRVLEKALSWKKPFSNFKNALIDMGSHRQEWFDFRDERMRQEIQDWLKFHDVDAKRVKSGETS